MVVVMMIVLLKGDVYNEGDVEVGDHHAAEA